MMVAALSQTEYQSLPNLRPAWFTPRNGLFDWARDAFRTGELTWDGSIAFEARLFNDLWEPDFTERLLVSQIPPLAIVAGPVALQGVSGDRGYCRSQGLRFPGVFSDRVLGGMVICLPSNGLVVWAASDHYGNLPVIQQDVYIVPSASFGGAWFRI